jgi:2-C-methyl-D-erythritol 4-phosphate cytidylyltransferase
MNLFSKLVNIGLDLAKRKEHKFCSAIIAAGGSSQRMNGINKQFAEIAGIPVLARTLMMFEHNSNIDEIIVVTSGESIGRVCSLCADYSIAKASKIIAGGSTRTQSVINGLNVVSPKAKLIAIADGARPLVTSDIINDTVKAASDNAAAAPGIPVISTVKRIENGCIKETVPRQDLVQIQTPQVFEASLIKAAIEKAVKQDIELTDDCMAVELMGMPIKLTKGSNENIKITTPFDLMLAEEILRDRRRNS